MKIVVVVVVVVVVVRRTTVTKERATVPFILEGRGLYTPPPSPPETPGIPECLGVTRAKSAYLFREESGGVHRKPAYSSGVRGIRPDFFR